MKTMWERQEERRAEKLAEIREEVAQGTLRIRQMTEKERAAQQLLGDRVEPPITRQAMLRQAEDAARLLDMRQV